MKRKVTQEDLDLNPELLDEGFVVGDEFEFEDEPTEEGDSNGLDDDEDNEDDGEVNPLPPPTHLPVIP